MITKQHAGPTGTNSALAGTALLTGVAVAAVTILWLRQSVGFEPQPPVVAIPPVGVQLPSTDGARSTTAATDGPLEASSLSDRVVGIWRREDQGERRLTIRSDGTATIDARVKGIGAFLYGSHLEIDLKWSLEKDIVTQTVTGGRPTEAVARLTRDWGNQRQFRVMAATKSRLTLANIDDTSQQQDWLAVKVPSTPTAGTPAVQVSAKEKASGRGPEALKVQALSTSEDAVRK